MLDREVQRFLDSKSFVVVVTDDKKLRTERVLTAGTGITITDAGAGGAVTISVNAAGVDHSGLGGLADDDHTQYALVSGTRAFTGDVTIQQSAVSRLIVKTTGADSHAGVRIQNDTRSWLIQAQGSDSDKLYFYDETRDGLAFALTAAGLMELAVQGSGGGILIGGDVQLYRGAADRLDIGSGDNINWPSSAITAIPGSGNVPLLAAFAANNGTQAAWLEVYINGTLSYIPYWQ